MSSGDHSFGSNNPFRRKSGAPVHPAGASSSSFGIDGTLAPPTTTIRPPLTTFKSAVQENERRDEEEQPVQQKPKKIVKKVRVQSPPPSSPEDAVPVTRFPAVEQLDDDDDDDSVSESSKSDDQADPFNAGPVDADGTPTSEPPLPPIPPNPFARTLQDIEGRGQAHDAISTATSTSKGSLDVSSFKRLLLTGYMNLPAPPRIASNSAGNTSGIAHHPAPTLPDGASNTDASSVSRQSILDALQETPRTSHEISEAEESGERKGVLPSSPLATVTSAAARKKPPPPPSSRHGKHIKIELGADSNSRDMKPAASSKSPDLPSPLVAPPRKTSSELTTPLHSPQATTDVNKPLPAPPLRASADEDVDSPFDREAAGKVPEAFADLQTNPRPPTPPPTTRSRSESQTSTQSRKPAAPPPRRHGRSDSSRVPSVHSINADEDPPRSSIESSRSRADSLRINVNSEKASHAPIPPPPRRPTHTRQGSSYASPNQVGFSPAMSPGLSERGTLGSGFIPIASPGIQSRNQNGLSIATAGPDGSLKLSPPPPPPTRKQSTRRPPSIRSMESSNGPIPVRRVSREKDGGAAPPPPPPPRARGISRPNLDPPVLGEQGTRKGSMDTISAGNSSTTSTPVGGGKEGKDILADLDALQREVDALMKKGSS
ncbi:hypothetical protein HD806DRAFT_510415 [Xylariaceae sp. AK1471]|nr:hypothetical protein HD806DRAFT_510415 [Xylariaceae sp. AK1471]